MDWKGGAGRFLTKYGITYFCHSLLFINASKKPSSYSILNSEENIFLLIKFIITFLGHIEMHLLQMGHFSKNPSIYTKYYIYWQVLIEHLEYSAGCCSSGEAAVVVMLQVESRAGERESWGWHLNLLKLQIGDTGASGDVAVDVIADDEVVVVVHNELIISTDLSSPLHFYQWKW